jgi:hypothetical protein
MILYPLFATGINNTSGTGGVVDIGGKFAAGVVDIGGKFATSGVDTGWCTFTCTFFMGKLNGS